MFQFVYQDGVPFASFVFIAMLDASRLGVVVTIENASNKANHEYVFATMWQEQENTASSRRPCP
jgi:hypothetical protein